MEKLEEMYKIAGKELADKIISVCWEDKEEAIYWFYTPCVDLENKSPNELCKENKRELYFQVEEALCKFENKMFS